MFEVDDALHVDALLRPTDGSQLSATTDRTDRPGPTAAAAQEKEIAGCQILGVLGEGGMGIVYKATTEEPEPGGCPEGHPRQPWARGPGPLSPPEAHSLARLEHPNIVHIHEVGEHAGQPYISLEFVDGVNLATFLDRTPQPAAAAAHLVEILARGPLRPRTGRRASRSETRQHSAVP